MSVASLITGGLGSFGSVPLLLLDGLGDFSGIQAGGGIDWDRWAEPPAGFRRILDTAGIDLAANRERLLNELRREIGLLRDEEPDPGPIEVEPIVELAPVAAVAAVLPEAPIFDRAAFIAELIAQVRAEDEMAKMAKAEREAWLRMDDEAVLLLIAAA